MEDFEKLGVFYLGKVLDPKTGQLKEDLLLYDSRDLVTHAVCVGMTGSGKTGLCISLIEEAAIDGIPAILIDPKGDLANLCLTFPNLQPSDFRPWISLDRARQMGLSPDDFAVKQAESWKTGLAGWGESGDRIKRLKDAADVLIYTPGSNAGLPVSILNSFAPPPQQIMDDSDLLRDRISSLVSSLLGLIGVDADPLQSREHILLSTIIENAWQKGQPLDLENLIQAVQEPPVTKIGVLNLESFYPSKERFALVMGLNNLVASPGFASWLQGTPLQIDQILYSPEGKPRIAIFSIAHLSDPERMFFVSLLMNQVLSWMRSQPGTTSLRALVYMDEIFGFLPPVANPPSKLPMLTMLKQARAFGVGMVLATQNPVDLDYKALSNAGTWFIGRLQTEQDKSRLMDGLQSASAAASQTFDRGAIEKIISGLQNRVFLMNNTHEDMPEVFQTRWALSYLRGPLTRDDIKVLMDPLKANSATPLQSGVTQQVNSQAISSSITQKPTLPPNISDFFIPVRGKGSTGGKLVYIPKLMGVAKVNFVNPQTKFNVTQTLSFFTAVTDKAIAVDWEVSELLDVPAADLDKDPQAGAQFSELPTAAAQIANYTTWNREFVNWLYGTQQMELFFSPTMKISSNPGESERDFRVRLQQSSREMRDGNLDQLRQKYSTKLAVLQERLRKAEDSVEKQQDQAHTASTAAMATIGSTLLGALVGRKINRSTINRASTAYTRARRTQEEKNDVVRAQDTVESIKAQINDLQSRMNDEISATSQKIDSMTEKLDSQVIKPRKTDILVQLVCLVWTPFWQDAQGSITPAW